MHHPCITRTTFYEVSAGLEHLETANALAQQRSGRAGGGQINVFQMFPQGIAADNPQLLQAAAGLQLRLALIGGG